MTFVPPPPPKQLLAGARVVAGHGFATVLPDLDFETWTPAGFVWVEESKSWTGPPGAAKGKKGLDVLGARNALAHPEAEILCASYDLKDGWGKRFWRPGMAPPADLFAHIQSGGLVEAWYVGYERWCWELICVPRMGWPVMQRWQWRCAMAKARAFGLPGGLAMAGKVMGTADQKDAVGGAVAKTFWFPRKPTKADPRTRRMPLWELPANPTKVQAADHADTLRLGTYNIDDVAAEAAISRQVPDLEGEELAWWQADQEINARGVHIDRASLENCASVLREALARYNGELLSLTGIDSASKVEQLQGWLRGRSVFLESLDQEAVEDALQGQIHDPQARRVLEIRAAIGSASVKKVFAMLNAAGENDRLHDLFIYHGARTGRCTGEGPQPTNLPKTGPATYRCQCGKHFGAHRLACPFCGTVQLPGAKPHEWSPEIAEQALEVLRSRSLQWVETVFGDALLTVAGVLRGMFTSAPGHDLISADYNSIEAIGLAMVAGEQWRIDVFRTHGAIYEASAARMFNVPFDDFMKARGYTDAELAQPEWWTRKPAQRTGRHHELRAKGKIGELAFGYQGWIGSALAFGMPGTEEEIKADILKWRNASPAVIHMWGGQQRRVRGGFTTEYWGTEGMAVRALLEPRRVFPVLRLDGTDSGVAFESFGGKLYMTLPSGRVVTYHQPELSPSERGGFALSYWGWNTNPKNGPKGWVQMRTWGGRLVENWNQAVCRDILRPAVLRLEAAKYPVVLHVYDEIVSEIPEGYGSAAEFERLMETRPAWAQDWPIRAPDAWRAKRYRKG